MCGILGIYTATSEEKAPEMLMVVCDEVEKLQSGVTDHELQRAKNQIKASLLMSRESSSSIAEWIGRHLINYGRYKTASEIAAAIDAVSEEDIRRASAQILAHGTPTLSALGPQKGLPDFAKVQERLG